MVQVAQAAALEQQVQVEVVAHLVLQVLQVLLEHLV
jgi:hypothetical protein